MGQGIRDFIEILEAAGELKRVKAEVDPHFEIAAILWKAKRGPAIFFEKVKGYNIPVIGNILNIRKKFAMALGIEEKDILEHFHRAIENPIVPEITEESNCRQLVIDRNIDLSKKFPIPYLCERDRNPYITAGVVIAKHPVTGKRNVSINRLQVNSKDTMIIGIAPTHHLGQILKECEKLGKRLEVSISIGNHPALLMAATTYVELGFDELEIAGALLNEPLYLSPGISVDVEAPSDAEIVIEGEIIPGELANEGPSGEFAGLYKYHGESPVVHVKNVTHRKAPIFQVIVPSTHPEHLLIPAVSIEATIYRALKYPIPRLKRVAVTEGGCGKLHVIVSVEKPEPGEAKKVILSVFSNLNLAKLVIVVDEDIDVHDPIQVEWAMATRMRAHKDVVIIPGVKTERGEPLIEGNTVTKMGIDATKPHDMPQDMFYFADVPWDIKKKVEENWENYFKDSD